MRLGNSALAASGTTGNHTGASVKARDPGNVVACQFVVEAVGGTPTVTFKFQGSLDGANWYDLLYVTDSSDTAASTTITVTGVGASVCFLDSANGSRNYNYYRCVTSSNTNVTYRAELYVSDND